MGASIARQAMAMSDASIEHETGVRWRKWTKRSSGQKGPWIQSCQAFDYKVMHPSQAGLERTKGKQNDFYFHTETRAYP
jgi:hypothetical protein